MNFLGALESGEFAAAQSFDIRFRQIGITLRAMKTTGISPHFTSFLRMTTASDTARRQASPLVK